MKKIFVITVGLLILSFRLSAARPAFFDERAISGEQSPKVEERPKDEQEIIEYLGGIYESPFKSFLPQKKEIEDVKEIFREQKRGLPSFNLAGIVWGGVYPQAIINGMVVKVGDKIEGVEILEIYKDRVKLLYEGSFFFLGTKDGLNDKEK